MYFSGRRKHLSDVSFPLPSTNMTCCFPATWLSRSHKHLIAYDLSNKQDCKILCLLDRASMWQLKNKRPTWCHLLFYFTSYVLNMFRALIYPTSGACDYSVELLHWSYCSWFDVCWSFGVVGLDQPATRIPLQTNHTETPTHIEPRKIDQCGNSTEKSQAFDDGYINVRNMLST